MSKKTSTSTQQVTIPQEVMDRYNAVNARAEGVAQNPFQQYGTEASDFVAQMNNQQTAGVKQINAASGAYKPYFDQAAASMKAGMASAQPQELNINQFLNPYQSQVIDATMKQMGQANEQAQSGALGTAVSSGAFGGDRAGIAAANLANQQGLAMGSTLAGLNAQNYSQALAAAQQQQGVQLGATQADLARLMQGGQFYAGLGTAAQQAGLAGGEAMLNAGTLQQQTDQAGLTALYNQFQQQQAYPFQVAQFLANIAMGTGALSGSTTYTTQPTPFFSDRRLKEDIKRIGKTDDGLPIYKFKYKNDPAEQTHVGFMADEVEQVKPEAVGLAGGYKTVDYDRATRATGGGVAGPYGAAAGSQNPYGAGYVPEAYLPVGQLMVADGQLIDMANQSLASQMDAANRFGESLTGLYDKYGAVKEKYNEWRERQRAQGEETPATGARYGGGIRPAYAYGGDAAYLRAGLGANQPVEKDTYLSDTLDSQSKRSDELMRPKGDLPEQRSVFGDIVDAGKMAMSLFGFERGGVVGYADGGSPLLREDIPEPQTLGSLPEARITPADLEGGLRAALINRPRGFYQPPAAAPVSEDRVIRLPEQPTPAPMTLPEGSPTSIPRESPLAPDTSLRPQARPTGLAAANTAAAPTVAPLPDGVVMGLAGGAIERAAAPEAPQAGLAPAAVQPEATPRTNTGVAPKGGYAPIVPLKTQLDFVLHELQQPAYDDYLKQSYESPAQAAIAFDKIYERSGGQGNDRAAAYAEDVYAAASAGDLSSLPPNAAAAYTHFVEGGMDPVKAAGATGRLMVESYAHLDPNARNTIGGGYGTYGLAQWRGERMENLADFAGVPLEALTSAPVSTPEGRYYASTSDGLGRASLSARNGVPQGGDDATFMDGARSFWDRNKSNPDMLLSILSGLGTMASSPSLYLGSAVLQGIGGAANTYMAREQQRSDITAKNLENMRNVAMDTMTWNEMNGTNLTPAQYAKAMGMTLQIPENASAQDILSGTAYTPTTDGGAGIDKISYGELQNGTISIDGKTVRMQDDPNSLRRFINDNALFPPDSPIGRQVAIAEQRLAEIDARGGVTFDINGNEVIVPSYVAAGNAAAKMEADRLATAQFRETGAARIPAIETQLAEIGKQAIIFSGLEGAAFNTEKASVQAALGALGFDVPETVASTQEAVKIAAAQMLGELGSGNLPGGAPASELARLQQIVASPDLQPEAIKTILAMKSAQLQRERDRYTMRAQWEAENGTMSDTDQFAYEQWFAENRPYAAYLENAKNGMPLFAGELGSKQKPHVVQNDSDFDKVPVGHYFIGPDGKVRGPVTR